MTVLAGRIESDESISWRKTALVLLCAGTVLLSGCAEDGKNGETVGAITGLVVGALLGSVIGDGGGQKIAMGVGAAAGAVIGGKLGAGLDAQDQMKADIAAKDALDDADDGESVSWSNPDSGNEGSYTPAKTFETADGQICREFSQTIVVDGETEEAVGSACKQEDGTWKIVDNG